MMERRNESMPLPNNMQVRIRHMSVGKIFFTFQSMINIIYNISLFFELFNHFKLFIFPTSWSVAKVETPPDLVGVSQT
jgi:hypothetical protein